MARYVLEVSYNGTAFHGSQVQENAETVQGVLNKALSTLFRKNLETLGASRTDEGVHALANYYHFDFDGELHPQFHYKLNAVLPFTVSVNKIFQALRDDINARFDAISRSYRYRIFSMKNPFHHKRAYYFPYRLDESILHETAQFLLQTKDFESFAKRNAQNHTFQCNIFEAKWERIEDQLHFTVTANRFLRGMVRALVGTQLQAARGKITVADFKEIIDAKDCRRADFSVPGHGLYLEKIAYPKGALAELELL